MNGPFVLVSTLKKIIQLHMIKKEIITQVENETRKERNSSSIFAQY